MPCEQLRGCECQCLRRWELDDPPKENCGLHAGDSMHLWSQRTRVPIGGICMSFTSRLVNNHNTSLLCVEHQYTGANAVTELCHIDFCEARWHARNPVVVHQRPHRSLYVIHHHDAPKTLRGHEAIADATLGTRMYRSQESIHYYALGHTVMRGDIEKDEARAQQRRQPAESLNST